MSSSIENDAFYQIDFSVFQLRCGIEPTKPRAIGISCAINKTVDAMKHTYLTPSKRASSAETRAVSLQQFVIAA
ncbi:MAG: hypothetical protein WBF58_08825 [Xanthobacteraceae bacterium]